MDDKLLEAAANAVNDVLNEGGAPNDKEPKPQEGEPTPEQQDNNGDGSQKEVAQPIKAWEQKINGRPYAVEMYPDKVVVRDKETGKEREISLEEFASKGLAADEKFEKAAELRKEIERERDALKRQRDELLELKGKVYEAGGLQALKEMATQLGIPEKVFSEYERQLEDAVDEDEQSEILNRAKRMVVEELDKKRSALADKERDIVQREVFYQYQKTTEILTKEVGDGDVARILATALLPPILQALTLPPEQRPAELKDVTSPADERVTTVIEKAAKNLTTRLMRKPITTQDDAESAMKLIREKYPEVFKRYIDEEVEKRLAELSNAQSPPSGRTVAEPPKVSAEERPTGNIYEAALNALRQQGILK